jgi:hypothetical protein
VPNFLQELVSKSGIESDHPVIGYLIAKTKAVDRDSKARRSLGNLYALYVLCEDYVNGNFSGSRFTDLLKRMKEMPFGSKLQNHPLDNRLNDEFRRKYALSDELLPVQTGDEASKVRKISLALLTYDNTDASVLAKLVVDSVDAYIDQITANQNVFLDLAKGVKSANDFMKYITYSLADTTDARVLEIVSFSILKNYYADKMTYIGIDETDFKAMPLMLYKTGRTNANDGGIDFVLKPLGRFFQVTEVIDFDKFFLDFEKVNRFPITFIVKTDLSENQVKESLYKSAKSKWGKENLAQKYIDLVEEVINRPILLEYANIISNDVEKMSAVTNEIVLQFQLEYGLLD